MLVNEKSNMALTVSFFDDTGAAVVPDSATYRIDDLTSSTSILAPTALTPATVVTIQITSAQNAILNSANQFEDRVITVEFVYATTKRGTDEYRYEVRNLYGVS